MCIDERFPEYIVSKITGIRGFFEKKDSHRNFIDRAGDCGNPHVRVGTVRSYDKEGGTGRIYGMYRQWTWRKRSGVDRCRGNKGKRSQSDNRSEVEEAP